MVANEKNEKVVQCLNTQFIDKKHQLRGRECLGFQGLQLGFGGGGTLSMHAEDTIPQHTTGHFQINVKETTREMCEKERCNQILRT